MTDVITLADPTTIAAACTIDTAGLVGMDVNYSFDEVSLTAIQVG